MKKKIIIKYIHNDNNFIFIEKIFKKSKKKLRNCSKEW